MKMDYNTFNKLTKAWARADMDIREPGQWQQTGSFLGVFWPMKHPKLALYIRNNAADRHSSNKQHCNVS